MLKKMLAIVVAVCSFAVMLNSAEDSGYKKWCSYRDKLMKDSSLVRYYTFEAGAGVYVENKVGGAEGKGDLNYVDLKAQAGESPVEDIKWIEGRWKGKKAVSLDQCSLTGEGYNIENKKITVEMWLRRNGHGALGGNDNVANGHIIGTGGYTKGWGMIFEAWAPIVGVEIGMGDSVANLHSTNVSSGEWIYIVMVWDSKFINIYLNGVSAGTKKYAGENVPSDSGRNLIIGYAQRGVGSDKIDFDEIAIYNRPLTPEEIKEHYEAGKP
jgi:hypothetical protein